MKRRSFRYRAMPFPAGTVRPMENRYANGFHFPFASGRTGAGTRKTFIIENVRRPFDYRSGQALPSPNAAVGKKVRRILILDNHPDSLRLVFGRQSGRVIDVESQGTSIWELVIVSVLTFVAVVGMFWPLL